MKIAIITHFAYGNNYGQRLQNISLVQYLKNIYMTDEIYTFGYNFRTGTKIDIKESELEKQYLKITSLDFENVNTFNNYDLYVFGSDQVFSFVKGMNRNVIDMFCGNLLIRNGLKHFITYSASANSRLGIYKKFICRNFKYISFREKNDVAKYNIINSTYNIDPVFLQSKEFWISCEKKPDFVDEHEIFDFYYNGGRKPFQIININNIKHIKLFFNNHISNNWIGYGEFLWLIHHCRKLITSSFHGFAFGIIYQKQCIEFKHNYRIDNLIEILNIKIENNKILNYNVIEENIKKEQERSKEYFLKSSVFNYCCYSKDKYIRDNSTSGGVCPELAKYVFNNNGIVYAARYNNDFTKVIIDSVNNLEDYFKYFVKSKYNFSYMPKLSTIKDQLENGKLIMYIGSPCQILALKTYLKKDYDNLILVDFKCRGFSESKKLENFTKNIESKYGSKIKNIDFRPNHRVDGVLVELNNGSAIKYKVFEYKDFVFNSLERCQKCKFDHGKISYSDITVSDFWFNFKNKWKIGEEFTPKNGCNHVRTNTLKGFIFFNKIKENLFSKQLRNAF